VRWSGNSKRKESKEYKEYEEFKEAGSETANGRMGETAKRRIRRCALSPARPFVPAVWFLLL
jgi:hypothetical protein